jgi:uncharacterized protein YycO
MQLVLARNRSFGSWLLRTLMWSQWSHSAIYDPFTNQVWDSTWLQGGVRRHHYETWKQNYPFAEFHDAGVLDFEGAREWLDAQVGKGYDWTALLSFVVHRNWQEDDKWFCSELTEMARDLFGKPRFRTSASRVTPQHQAMLL